MSIQNPQQVMASGVDLYANIAVAGLTLNATRNLMMQQKRRRRPKNMISLL
jgi:hypothetical protein